jgi:squalene-associated FAD-dependent desaturase
MNRSVIIVGGGLSGIAASLALQKAGYQVTLLESRQKLGGRVGSFDEDSGQAVDYCQHVGMACCTNLIKLLQLTNLDHLWSRDATLHFYSFTGQHIPVQKNGLPAPFHLSGLLYRWPDLRVFDRAIIAYGLWRLMSAKLENSMTSESAFSWLTRHAQSPTIINKFWSTILVSALGDKIERVSIAAARKVLVDGFAAHHDAYSLLVPQRPLSEIFSDSMLPSLRVTGVDVRLGNSVRELIFDQGRCVGVKLSNHETIRSDVVIIAVPWHRIKKLFPDQEPLLIETREQLDKFATIESAPITGVHTWWDTPWLDHPHAILVDRLCQWVFANPVSNESKLDAHYYQIVISGSRDLPRGDHKAVIQAVKQDLRSIFPKLAHSKLLRSRIVTDPHSVFSITPESKALRPNVDALANQNIWLSGDWTNTGWPATMEGAIRSGFLAAESIAKHFGNHLALVESELPKGWLARCMIRDSSH